MGKKSKKSSTTETAAVRVDGKGTPPVEDSMVERAKVAMESSNQQMLMLHRTWRSQLQKISIVVMCLLLKESPKPAYKCIDEIQEWNERITTSATFENDLDTNSLFIGHWETGKRCIAHSLMEFFSILCCLSVLWLLYQPLLGDDFSSIPFQLTIFFVPLIVASYSHSPMTGCLGDLAEANDIENEGADPVKPRSFPNVLILLVVCFGSLYLMQLQQRRQTENARKFDKLRENMLEINKKKK